MLPATLLMLLAVTAPGPAAGPLLGSLSRKDMTRFQEAFTAAFAKPDGDERAALLSLGEELQAKYDMDDLVDALRKGPSIKGKPRARKALGEKFDEVGGVTMGYQFTAGDETFQYEVQLPKGYGGKPVPLVIDSGVHKGKDWTPVQKAGVARMTRNWANQAGLKKAIVIRTEIIEKVWKNGRRGARPDAEVAVIFEAFHRDVFSRMRVDLNRIYMAGQQQTGYWALYLGQARPDRYAGAVSLMPPSISNVLEFTRGFWNLPVYIGQGALDEECKPEPAREVAARMEQEGCPMIYNELKNAAHDDSVAGLMPAGLKFAIKKGPRDPYPKKPTRSLSSLLTPWCYWIRVDGLESSGYGGPSGWVEGDVDGQTVRVTSEGISALTVCLSSEMLDLDEEVVIEWNGNNVHRGIVTRDFGTTLELAIDKVDWVGTFEVAIPLTMDS